MMRPFSRWSFWVVLLGCLCVLALRLDRAAGLVVDDAYYLMSGKALATGYGFTMINAPTPGIVPFYPPFFPFLLSLIFRLAPSFPQNIPCFKLFLVATAAGQAGLVYYYFSRMRLLPSGISLLIMAAALLNPGVVFLATSTMMSETVYALLQTGALILLERGLGYGTGRLKYFQITAASVLLALAYLTRSIGIGLVCGAAAYLLFRKEFKALAIMAALLILIIAPWQIYTMRHRPTPQAQLEQGYITQSYLTQLWTKDTSNTKMKVGLSAMPGRIMTNLVEIGERDVGEFIAAPLYRPSNESGTEVIEGGVISPLLKIPSLLLTAVIFIGFVAAFFRGPRPVEFAVLFQLAIIVCWPWLPYRFLVPLLPFLFFYFVTGVSDLSAFIRIGWRRGTKDRQPFGEVRTGSVARICMEFVLVFCLYDHTMYLLSRYGLYGEPVFWLDYNRQVRDVAEWVGAHTSAGSVIAADNPALLYLYTDRKTIRPRDADASLTWSNVGQADYFVHLNPFSAASPENGDGRLVYRPSNSNFFVLSYERSTVR